MISNNHNDHEVTYEAIKNHYFEHEAITGLIVMVLQATYAYNANFLKVGAQSPVSALTPEKSNTGSKL